jgi:hypothetical protein
MRYAPHQPTALFLIIAPDIDDDDGENDVDDDNNKKMTMKMIEIMMMVTIYTLKACHYQ